MSQRTSTASIKHHTVFLVEIVRRAAELEQRAIASGAKEIRRAEALRERRAGYPRLLAEVDTIISATESLVASAGKLRHAIARVILEEPQATRCQRWSVRSDLIRQRKFVS
jgi:hypothetical protein